MQNINKQFIASELRSSIEHYTELTVLEHQNCQMTKDADRAWAKIEKLIHQLEVTA
jgi:hypothetical protein